MIKIILTLYLLFSANLLANEELLGEQLIYLQMEEVPKTIYKNQILKISYNIIIATEFLQSHIDLHSFNGVEILTPYAPLEMMSENKYKLEVYVKIIGDKVKFPNLTLAITTKDGNSYESINGAYRISYNIAQSKDYINVVADDFKINSHKVEKFNDTNNILTLSLEGKMSNLEDINITYASNQGFDSKENDYPISKLLYYAVIPNYIKKITLSTFEPKKGVYIKHKIFLDFSNIGQRVSTQVDINPNKRSFPILEMIIIGFILLFVFILLIKTRHWFFLLIIALLIGYSSWILLKEDSVLIKSNSSVYILPIKNSTLFMITDRPLSVIKLREKEDFIKIILPNKNIGWVKKENVSSY